MTNVKLLEAKIKERGLKKGYIAEQLGVSRAQFTSLLNNKAEFKLSQLTVMCRLLNITDDAEIKAIFFNVNGA